MSRQTIYSPVPEWVTVAEHELGVRELVGRQHNGRILDYLETALNIGRWGRSRDETAWCAAFVNWCLKETGIRGTDNALASSFITYGQKVLGYRLGAIAVLRHKSKSDATTGSLRGFHVGFLIRETSYSWRILGGNQSNSVSYRNFPKRRYRLAALRWPVVPPVSVPSPSS
jgi:uncharacterized protein (TIGR02594 family)